MVEPLSLQPMIEVLAAELCADCALAGVWDEAQTYALQALENRTNFFVASTRLTLWYETEALARAGEIERATEDVMRYGERIGASRRYRICYLRALAVLAQYSGESDQAIGLLQEAEKLAEEIGLPGELWPIQVVQGDLYLAQGDRAEAHTAFGKAAAIVQKLGDSIGDDKQKANFLASPLTQRVLEHRSFGQ